MSNTKAGLKPYPAYKELEIPWLGKVPTHWTVAETKNFYEIQMGKMLQPQPAKTTDIEVPYLKAVNVQWYSVQTDNAQTMWASPEEIEQLQVIPGDLLVCEGGEGGRAGIAKAIPNGFIIQNALHRVRPKRAGRNELLQHLMKVISETGWFDAINNKATIAHLTKEKFASLPIPVPPLEEQDAIVRYLDDADQRIRAYVSAKERLIALLEEERQAVIHQAVTRGLDPNVRLKPSGTEWLGDVPEHWRLVPNKAVLRLKKDVVENDTSNYTLLSLTKQGIIPRNMEDPTGKFPANFESYQIVEPGDLVFCLFDVDETPRTVGLSTLHGMVTGAYTRFTCQKGTMGNFLFLLYLALDNNKLLKPLYSGLRKTIPKSSFLSAKIALPTKEEQASIVEHLDNATADIDASIARARREVELMEEYRTRLIADVVTGKIDVRDAATFECESA